MKVKQIQWTKINTRQYEGHIGYLKVFDIVMINKDYHLYGLFDIRKTDGDINLLKEFAQGEIKRYIKMFLE